VVDRTSKGKATSVIRAPSVETAWPVHSNKKFRLRHNDPVEGRDEAGQRPDSPASPVLALPMPE
jgi:hypothetical protein